MIIIHEQSVHLLGFLFQQKMFAVTYSVFDGNDDDEISTNKLGFV